MPAIRTPITVEAGSYEPIYFQFTDPDTGDPLDLTAAGYVVTGRVSTARDDGATLLDLPDATYWRRTADGRVYFEPLSTQSTLWTFRRGYLQAEITHPSGAGHDFRFVDCPLRVSPELVVP